MNKHTAIDPSGNVHTRNSKTRVYSHTVVARTDPEERRLYAIESAERQARTNYNFFCGKGSCSPYTTWNGKPDTETVLGVGYRSAEEFLAAYPTVESFVEAHINDSLRKHELWVRNGGGKRWYNCGWNGRLDLAQKLADKERGIRCVAEVKILEAKLK